MSNDKNEIQFESSVLRIALENNALLKTVLHYLEKSEAARSGKNMEEVEAYTDELLNHNMQQAMDLLKNEEE